jgi:hypothetical protein
VSADPPASLEAPEAIQHAPEANSASVTPIELARPVDVPLGALTTPPPRARRIALVAGGVVGLIALLGLLRVLLRPATETGVASTPQATQSVASPPPVAEEAPVPKPEPYVPPAAPTAASVDEPETTPHAEAKAGLPGEPKASPGIEPAVAPEPPGEAPPAAASKALPPAPALPRAPVQARPPPLPRNGVSGPGEQPEPPPFRPSRI